MAGLPPPPKVVYIDGEWMPFERANVPITTHALHYGTGVFGGLRGYWDEELGEMRTFRLPLHVDRMKKSCELLRINRPEVDVVKIGALIGELVHREGWREDVYIRPLAFKGHNPSFIGVNPTNVRDSFAMYGVRYGMDAYYSQDKLLDLWISKQHVQLPEEAIPRWAKITGAYANSAIAVTEAKDNGCDDVLLPNELGPHGRITEGHASNFFIVQKGVLKTPPQGDSLLPGITRKTILDLAQDEMGLDYEEDSIEVAELEAAHGGIMSNVDEAFFCGTGVGVVPVGSIDGNRPREWEKRPATRKVQQTYADHVRGRCDKHRFWLDTVYKPESVTG